MLFNAVFSIVSIPLQWPVHLSRLSWTFLTNMLRNMHRNILTKPLAAFPHDHCEWLEKNESCHNDISKSPAKKFWSSGSNISPLFMQVLYFSNCATMAKFCEKVDLPSNAFLILSSAEVLHWVCMSVSQGPGAQFKTRIVFSSAARVLKNISLAAFPAMQIK